MIIWKQAGQDYINIKLHIVCSLSLWNWQSQMTKEAKMITYDIWA
jgi:hypothetical protein